MLVKPVSGLFVLLLLCSHASIIQLSVDTPSPTVPCVPRPSVVESLQNLVVVIIEEQFESDLRTVMSRFAIEAGYQGFQILIEYIPDATTPYTIRSRLQTHYENGLVGCLLIGNLSAPIFRQQDGASFEEFPIDLYFMDLDGIFGDLNTDGILDWHGGNIEPEIFLGRLSPTTLYNFGNASELLQSYFHRNSLYRRGTLRAPQRVLTFIDDDWAYLAPTWYTQASLVYPEGTLIREPDGSSAAAYLQELNQSYEFVLVGAHSNPTRHAFQAWGGWDYVYSKDIFALQSTILFANLFACSAADYRFANYLAGAYVFSSAGPLAVIGSTKTGSMYDFNTFFQTLAQGRGLGAALQLWLQSAVYPSPEMPDSPQWCYGMTCLGDPMLPVMLNHSDADHDGLPTFWESMFELNLAQPDAARDEDGDALTNAEEFTLFTHPRNPDTDLDWMPDGWESRWGLNLFENDSWIDYDLDRLTNYEEYCWGCNPWNSDTDADGLRDDYEIEIGTNPVLPDTDADGLIDSLDLLPTHHWAIIIVPLLFVPLIIVIIGFARKSPKQSVSHDITNYNPNLKRN
ncbi:MAG: C25 family cysteine peptidase [Candidatus Hodarchaeota archaeon]